MVREIVQGSYTVNVLIFVIFQFSQYFVVKVKLQKLKIIKYFPISDKVSGVFMASICFNNSSTFRLISYRSLIHQQVLLSAIMIKTILIIQNYETFLVYATVLSNGYLLMTPLSVLLKKKNTFKAMNTITIIMFY